MNRLSRIDRERVVACLPSKFLCQQIFKVAHYLHFVWRSGVRATESKLRII